MIKRTHYWITFGQILVLLLGIALVTGGCKKREKQAKDSTTSKENKTAGYLENAEVQYETEAQKKAIITALKDILTLEEKQLRAKKYPDYTGEESKWTVEEVLQRYFVPDQRSKHINADFYEEIKKQRTKEQIKSLLAKLE